MSYFKGTFTTSCKRKITVRADCQSSLPSQCPAVHKRAKSFGFQDKTVNKNTINLQFDLLHKTRQLIWGMHD